MDSYSGYDAIAHVYDKLNEQIDYKRWADFIEAAFERFLHTRPEIVLDLACGTGTMTRELASRGYDMIGVDGSADMLSEAYMKGADGILYLKQDMREFELYGTVGAITCCLDSINYLTNDGELEKVFALAHNYLDPDGLFLFDINTPHKFENVYADNAYILEDAIDGAPVYCGWQNAYDKESRICNFYLSVFAEQDGVYLREDEEQHERCYTREDLESTLTACGFEILGVYRDYQFGAPMDETERWYFAARKI